MNLHKKNLTATFFIALLFSLFMPATFPQLRLFFFAPFIVTSFYQMPLSRCLWTSCFVGLIIDLFLSQDHIGVFALTLTIASWILFNERRNFFADKVSTLPIMTYLYSALSTFIQIIVMYGLDKEFQLTFGWALTDILIMPGADAIYAFVIFILPFAIFGKPVRQGKDYFESHAR